MTFSDSSTQLGLVEQVRNMMRVDSTQWPTSRIVASANNYRDTLTGYAIGADNRFTWDDTNHTALPIGTQDVTINVSDYSFATDQQGNQIITLTRVDMLRPDGLWQELTLLHEDEIDGAIDEYAKIAGIPTQYIKLSDNVIRLKPTPSATVTDGLKMYFQRTSSYFAASDTTKTTGFSNLLDRGFVISAAYDGALTLGLPNIQALSAERLYEEKKMIQYFGNRNEDERSLNISGECIESQ